MAHVFYFLNVDTYNLYLFTPNEYGKSQTRFLALCVRKTKNINQISEKCNSRGVVAFQSQFEISYLDIAENSTIHCSTNWLVYLDSQLYKL